MKRRAKGRSQGWNAGGDVASVLQNREASWFQPRHGHQRHEAFTHDITWFADPCGRIAPFLQGNAAFDKSAGTWAIARWHITDVAHTQSHGRMVEAGAAMKF
jgi:hypothetical protein